jgi:hypothetical protein
MSDILAVLCAILGSIRSPWPSVGLVCKGPRAIRVSGLNTASTTSRKIHNLLHASSVDGLMDSSYLAVLLPLQ